MQQFTNNSKKQCYSQCMTPNEAIIFWSDSKSINDTTDIGSRLRFTAINYLLQDHTQSGVERSFSKLKRNTCPIRNKLNSTTILHECMKSSFKKNHNLFQKLRRPKVERDKKKETADERESRHGYNNQIIKCFNNSVLTI